MNQSEFKKNKKRLKFKPLFLSVTLIGVLIVAGELFAKFYLGLGTPPLYMPHATIEYMHQPNQDLYRFGNHFITNHYGMRTKPFPIQKQNNEYRVMAFGDSVLNGGGLTDHSQLATTILQKKLSKEKQNPTTVGNISAASWGPGNWLAYAQEFGLFEADVIILLISSQDYDDIPTFAPLDRESHPSQKPISALFEGITKYLPRYLPFSSTAEKKEIKPDEKAISAGLNDLKKFLELAQKQTPAVLILQHYNRAEVDSKSEINEIKKFNEIYKEVGIAPISLKPYYRRSITEGKNPFRDYIHLNQTGQQLLADAISENLTKVSAHQNSSQIPEPR